MVTPNDGTQCMKTVCFLDATASPVESHSSVSCINERVSNILKQCPVRRLLAAGLLLSSVLLSACGGASDPGVTSTSTVQPVETQALVSSTPTFPVESSPTLASEVTSSPTSPPPQAVPTVTPTTPPTETAIPEEVESAERHINLGDFEAALNDLVRDVDGTVAVTLAAVDGTVLWDLNADETMEAASLYKLAIMVEIYRQQAVGDLAFDDLIELTGSHFAEGEDSFSMGDIGAAVDIETLLTAMITQSSNVAAYALLGLVSSASVNATMTDLGLDGIEIRWSPQEFVPEDVAPESSDEIEPDLETDETDEPATEETEEPSGEADPVPDWLSIGTGVTATIRGETAFNVTRASDLAQLLVLMLNGSVVNESASQQMLDLLARQEIYGGLPALLPEGAVAHKTGYLDDGVVNDAGVIYTPHGPMVAVVLTEGTGEGSAYDITSRIGLLLYQLGSD